MSRNASAAGTPSGPARRTGWLGISRLELAVGAGISAVALALYLATAAPGLTWENLGGDGGDLLTAAFTWGVPHPSGYPTYLISLRLFSAVFPFGDEAFRGNVLSALLAAVSVGLIYLTTLRLVELMPFRVGLRSWTLHSAAAVAALAIAVSPELWSQATITEVYSLNALFVSALLLGVLILYRRERDGGAAPWLRALMAFGLGLALGNHLTIGLMALPFIVWSYLWHAGGRAARARLRDPRAPAALLAGLAVYIYPPLASSRDPLLNWGHPDTLRGFWWMVSGSIYQDYAFGVEASRIAGRVVDSGNLFLAQFGFVGLVPGIAGLSFVWEALRGFAAAAIGSILLVAVYAILYDTVDSFLYLIPAFMLVSVWLGVGTAALLAAMQRAPARLGPRFRRAGWYQIAVLLAILAAAPGFTAFVNFDGRNLRDDRAASDFARGALETAGPGSVIAASESNEIFSLWYQSYVAEPEADVLVISIPHLQFDWYWDDMRRQAPDRIPATRPQRFEDRVRAIADYNLGRRPVYTANEIPVYTREYVLVEEGMLHRVER